MSHTGCRNNSNAAGAVPAAAVHVVVSKLLFQPVLLFRCQRCHHSPPAGAAALPANTLTTTPSADVVTPALPIETLMEDEQERYQAHFADYIKARVEPDNIEVQYEHKWLL